MKNCDGSIDKGLAKSSEVFLTNYLSGQLHVADLVRVFFTPDSLSSGTLKAVLET